MSRRKRNLTADDEALWATTTMSVDPLSGKARGRVSGSEQSSEPSRESNRVANASAHPKPVPLHDEINAKKTWQKLETKNSGVESGPVKTPQIADGFDLKRARKIARGQMEIDGRIDLHGMRRDEARRALRGFLHRAQLQNYRTILVITGKGRTENPDRPWFEADGRGVLKREVPVWLAGPDLSPLVVGFTDASRRHGGDGALYVHVRRMGKR